MTTRREFMGRAAAMAAMTAVPSRLCAQTGPAAGLAVGLATDPRRPQFHLLPAKNWMNDPNGPIYFNGQYHMFFQYNPLAAVWGDMSWYHSTSPDMLHWKHLPVAFTPTPDSPDSFGCFSGSALQVGKRVYQVYTGTKLGPREKATIMGDANPIQESQSLAWSDDPHLVHWTKLPEPIIPLPPPGMAITGFRDPSAWKQGDLYYMTVGAGEANVGGCVLLYRSTDLRTWEYLHKLTSGAWNGHKTQNPCDDGEMWECPDLFPLDGQHVLIYSTLNKVFWQSGILDPEAMTFTAKKTGELDLGAFYAPKTQLDAKGRRILWGWIREKRFVDDRQNDAAMIQAGWSGMMSLPRVLSLDKDGTLRITALPETAGLRGAALRVNGLSAGKGVTIPKACGESLCIGGKSAALSWRVNNGDADLVSIEYKPQTHSFVADGKEIVLQPNDVPSVHIYIDGSVMEILLSERIGYTRRFYYPGSAAPDLSVMVESTKPFQLGAWSIKPISGNRLTTPA